MKRIKLLCAECRKHLFDGIAMMAVAFIGLSFGSDTSLAASKKAIEAVDRSALRVCSDPNNMPFTNDKGEGFENDIAVLLADWLGIPVSYEYFPQVIAFARNTLSKKKCDVIIGTPTGDPLVLNTNPYYRWGYAMIYLADAGIEVDRPDHPQLAELRLGTVAGTPPNNVIHRYNLMSRVRPYKLLFDTRIHNVGQEMIEDLIDGLIDIAYISQPVGEYYLRKSGLKPGDYVVVPIESWDQNMGKMDFLMTMGVRPGETDWKHTLNRFLQENKDQIKAILARHHVPTRPLRPKRKKRTSASAP